MKKNCKAIASSMESDSLPTNKTAGPKSDAVGRSATQWPKKVKKMKRRDGQDGTIGPSEEDEKTVRLRRNRGTE